MTTRNNFSDAPTRAEAVRDEAADLLDWAAEAALALLVEWGDEDADHGAILDSIRLAQRLARPPMLMVPVSDGQEPF